MAIPPLPAATLATTSSRRRLGSSAEYCRWTRAWVVVCGCVSVCWLVSWCACLYVNSKRFSSFTAYVTRIRNQCNGSNYGNFERHLIFVSERTTRTIRTTSRTAASHWVRRRVEVDLQRRHHIFFFNSNRILLLNGVLNRLKTTAGVFVFWCSVVSSRGRRLKYTEVVISPRCIFFSFLESLFVSCKCLF